MEGYSDKVPTSMVPDWPYLPTFVDGCELPCEGGKILLREGLRRDPSLALSFGGVEGGVMTVGPKVKSLATGFESLLTSTNAVSAFD